MGMSLQLFVAIYSSAKKLQQDYGQEIARMYRTGSRIDDIVRAYGLTSELGCKPSTARSVVIFALKGTPYTDGDFCLDGLLDEEEFSKIATNNRKRGIERMKEGKYGFFGRDKIVNINSGKESAKARGLALWEDTSINNITESQYLEGLLCDPMYIHDQKAPKNRQGLLNVKKIVAQLNQVYHDGKPVRSYKAVEQKIKEIRRAGKIKSTAATIEQLV